MCDTEVGVNLIRKWNEKLGSGMDEVIPHLYIGSLRDAMSREQLESHNIKAVVSVYDFGNDELGLPNLRRMRLKLADSSAENVRDHFSEVNSFIHHTRINQENVLVHCLAGASRSVCFVVAYIITVTNLDYPAALAYVSQKRICAEPNFGFRMQLHKFGLKDVTNERERLRQELNPEDFDTQFMADCLHTNSLHLKNAFDPNLCLVPQIPDKFATEKVDDFVFIDE